MSAFVIYKPETGAIRGVYRVAIASDAVMTANTPAGMTALVVDEEHACVTDQTGWKIADGTLVQIVPSAAVLLATAQVAQSGKIEKSYQNATFQTPITYQGTIFWTDQNSQFLLMGAVIGFQQVGGVPEGFAWWDAKGIGIPMALAELQGLYQAILNQVNTNFVKRKALLAQIAAATTVDQVQAIVW